MYTNRFEHYLWCLIQQNHLKSVFQAINGYWRHFPCTPIVHIHLHPAAYPYAGKISKDSDDFLYEESFRIVPKCTVLPLDPVRIEKIQEKSQIQQAALKLNFESRKSVRVRKVQKVQFSPVYELFILKQTLDKEQSCNIFMYTNIWFYFHNTKCPR